MNVREAIEKRRTIRKFKQESIDAALLYDLIDCARLAAYGGNIQPLKFMAINDEDTVGNIFKYTKWSGYVTEGAPTENERPTAFIAVLGDTDILKSGNFEVASGAAVTNMMLRATELNLATCWLGSIDRNEIPKILNLPQNLELVYLLAVGIADMESRICEAKDGDIKYFLDNNVLNVPKRSMEEIVVKF